jgi:hydroxypyruvate isomerase
MPLSRFSANISMLFHELPFLERFAAARRAGFAAVECWFPYEHSTGTLRQVLADNGLTLVGINTAPGAAGEWGITALPGREDEFSAQVKQAVEFAVELGASSVHVMAALTGGIPHQLAEAAYLENLARAVRIAEGSGVQLLIEPLNGRDRPGYFLRSSDQAAAIIARSGLTSLKLLFDCYHVQVEDGDLTMRLRRHWPIVGHIQIAGVPDRGEPDTGEIDYGTVLAETCRLGWSGWIGAEYRPRSATVDGLGWMRTLQPTIESAAGARSNG